MMKSIKRFRLPALSLMSLLGGCAVDTGYTVARPYYGGGYVAPYVAPRAYVQPYVVAPPVYPHNNWGWNRPPVVVVPQRNWGGGGRSWGGRGWGGGGHHHR